MQLWNFLVGVDQRQFLNIYLWAFASDTFFSNFSERFEHLQDINIIHAESEAGFLTSVWVDSIMNVLGDSKSRRTESVNDRTDQCGTWSEWLEVVEKLQVFRASSNLHSLTIKNSCFAEQKSLQSFSIFLVSGISLKSCLSFVLNLNFKLYHYASLLRRRENDWQADVTVISSLNLKLMIIYCKEALTTDSTSPCSFFFLFRMEWCELWLCPKNSGVSE